MNKFLAEKSMHSQKWHTWTAW